MADERTETPTIFVYLANRRAFLGNDLYACAIAEDGHVLASHVSSSIGFVKRDMGLTPYCNWQHDHYGSHYPTGYKLVDLTDLTDEALAAHEGLQAAFAAARELSSIPPDGGVRE